MAGQIKVDAMTAAFGLKLRFLGQLAIRAGGDERFIELGFENSGTGTAEALKSKIDEIIGANVLYSILINGRSFNMLLKEGREINNGDEITVVPVILGG